MVSRLYIFCSVLLCSLYCSGAVVTKTPLLHDMAKALDLEKYTFQKDTSVLISPKRGNLPIVVRTDEKGRINHIGYPIIPEYIKEDKTNRVILDFIERYFLQIDLNLNGISAGKRLEIDGVKILNGNLNQIINITPEIFFDIRKYNRKAITFSWGFPNIPLVVDVPSDRELILGASSPQLEEIFMGEISEVKEPIYEDLILTLSSWGYDIPIRDNTENEIILLEGKPYLSDLIRSDLFINSSNGKISLYDNPNNPSRSIPNLMLTGITDKPVKLDLIIDRYGNKKDKIQTTLGKLLRFFREEEGCEIFFGIKSMDGINLSGTLFALNNDLSYNHVLSVEVPMHILDNPDSSSITGTLYAYIPLQNVYDAFFYENVSLTPYMENKE